MSSQRGSQAPRVPKVRQSCDTCQASKIRCGQERPRCHRCEKYNLDCVYSVSRRAGRPRPKRTIDPTTPVGPSPTHLQSTPDPQTGFPTQIGPSPTHEECRPRLASLRQKSITPVPEATRRDTAQNTGLEEQQCHDPPVKSTQGDRSSNHGTDVFPRTNCYNSNQYEASHMESEPGLVPDNSNSSISSNNNNNNNNNNSNDDAMDAMDVNPYFNDAALFRHVDSAQFPTLFFSDSDLLPEHVDFDLLMAPLPDCACFPTTAFPHAPLPLGAGPVIAKSSGPGCHCTTMLLQHLDAQDGAETGCSDERLFARAVQRSRVLLDNCLVVLSCGACSTRTSSALVVCQAMEELSVTLGMGTLWVEGTGAGHERCPLLGNLAKDEVPMRCGSYAVRGTDRQVLLRLLVMNRLTEMQRIMGKLCQAVGLSSSCRATCAGMAAELERRVLVKLNMFRAAAP
ncbi:uncharacterized protein M421DRAFT_51167 [Didymella exigua CBS 183.55]|uniref:Zn(2)-C6 fungal-type domain-containing protein n=1 Tax=Didymella exigua CBS 183.55 TaxID=1150837 RepID=A0A6A5S3B2_9PLEO|nr:uncharacterized protein M421DRAFT_51167 [Didymella exigua CBS 183.55]KAF1934433.1 hypothetical protein M421DRAFT_51167 [Didymella exigua CBS 183.55]